MSTTKSTTNNCPNGNCDTDGDDISDLKIPEENNVFQILFKALIWSLFFSLIYFAIQYYSYDNFKIFYLLLLVIPSIIIAGVFGTISKSKDSSCTNRTVWINSCFFYGPLIIIILAIGLLFAPFFESEVIKNPFKNFNKQGYDLVKFFSKDNKSIAVNIFLGYPIILLLVWNGTRSDNCII